MFYFRWESFNASIRKEIVLSYSSKKYPQQLLIRQNNRGTDQEIKEKKCLFTCKDRWVRAKHLDSSSLPIFLPFSWGRQQQSHSPLDFQSRLAAQHCHHFRKTFKSSKFYNSTNLRTVFRHRSLFKLYKDAYSERTEIDLLLWTLA